MYGYIWAVAMRGRRRVVGNQLNPGTVDDMIRKMLAIQGQIATKDAPSFWKKPRRCGELVICYRCPFSVASRTGHWRHKHSIVVVIWLDIRGECSSGDMPLGSSGLDCIQWLLSGTWHGSRNNCKLSGQRGRCVEGSREQTHCLMQTGLTEGALKST